MDKAVSEHLTSRRNFLRTMAQASVAVAGFTTIGRAADASKPPKVLRIAIIGTGGIGGAMIKQFGDLGCDCVCYADVDTSKQGEAVKRWPSAKGYQDYRQMFEKHAKEIDAVIVGTPDHHHYPATVLAMKLKKAVYTQKPLTQTVWEARELTKAAQKYRVVTQMGNQGHAGQGWRIVYEYIRTGMLGAIKEVHNWTNRPIWPQGIERPAGEDPIPAELNWDCWIGPAPMRPFKKDVYHPFKWRGWFDFGAGALGDMACHTMDGLFWALDPGYPTAVEPLVVEGLGKETFPKASVIKWEFPAKGGRPAFTAFWYDGGKFPQRPPELEKERELPKTGNLFIGTKATLLVAGDYGDSPMIIPETKRHEMGKPKQLLERSPGHYKEFVMAATGEKPASFCKSNFAYAGPFSEAILLGNIALRVGKRLEWDGRKMKSKNSPEATQLVSKEYRKGWDFKI
ncbi:MAG: Gfo/Idh/MocA family oxidoreductase [Verrucomicrobia bacterium]|nr:Gfo/Idh/MocA family oxidoreductase [Verrucomicrobiota bacterium]